MADTDKPEPTPRILFAFSREEADELLVALSLARGRFTAPSNSRQMIDAMTQRTRDAVAAFDELVAGDAPITFAGLPDELEQLLEKAFWEYEARKKRPGMPQSPRDAFKWSVRGMLNEFMGE